MAASSQASATPSTQRQACSTSSRRIAYERLILDVIHGDNALFVRRREFGPE